MTNLTINIDDIQTLPKNYKTFYHCSEFEIRKNGKHIESVKFQDGIESTSNSRIECPLDYKDFNLVDSDDKIVLILGGKHIVEYDKMYNELSIYDIPLTRIGRAFNDLFWSDNNIIFSTNLNGQIQFIKYDYCNQKKLAQSSSWKLHQTSSVAADKNALFATLDNTFVVAINIETCEQLWSRFEAGVISEGLLPYKNGVIYAKPNSLFIMNIDGTFSKLRVTETKIDKLLDVSGNNVYFTSNDNKDLCCYSMKSESLLWSIKGTQKIKSGFVCSGVKNKSKNSIMILMAENHIGIADLSINFIRYVYSQGITNIYKCNDCLLIDKAGEFSGVIYGNNS